MLPEEKHMIEKSRHFLPREIYEKVLNLLGLGPHGPEWNRRLEVTHVIHYEALKQERSGKQTEEIFDYIKEELTRERIGWAESEQFFAVKADHEEKIYPKLILAKVPGDDSDPRVCGWEVYYEGEASERDEFPNYFYFQGLRW